MDRSRGLRFIEPLIKTVQMSIAVSTWAVMARIGAPLIVYMNNYRWDVVGSILIVLFVTVLLIELLSKCLKKIH